MGRSQSPEIFTVSGSVSIITPIDQLITNETANLTCVESGNASQGIEWSILGQSGTLLGTIDQSGYYAAPAAIPSTNPITVRCQSVPIRPFTTIWISRFWNRLLPREPERQHPEEVGWNPQTAELFSLSPRVP